MWRRLPKHGFPLLVSSQTRLTDENPVVPHSVPLVTGDSFLGRAGRLRRDRHQVDRRAELPPMNHLPTESNRRSAPATGR